MTDIGWLFVYTPFPWLVAMYVAAYRHDLSRLARPFRDQEGATAWWSVCRYLGLISAGVPKPPHRAQDALPPSSLVALSAAAILSLLPLVISAPLAWYYLAALQVASAVTLFLLLVSRIGPLPSKPYRDVLPYPRLGTRVRHLQKPKGAPKHVQPGSPCTSKGVGPGP